MAGGTTLGHEHPTLTIGSDARTAAALEGMGCTHTDCPTTQFVIDRENRIVSTPAYMLGPSIDNVQQGIDRIVGEALAMIGQCVGGVRWVTEDAQTPIRERRR